MSWAAVIVGGSVLLSAYLQKTGTEKAAGAQIEAAQAAGNTQLQMYYQTRLDYAPWREAGEGALNQINRILADPSLITSMPGYEFGLEQGTQALERGAAARGRQLSGPQLNALQRFGQDYASTQMRNYLNPYFLLAGLGSSATGGTAQAGTQAAQGQSNALMAAMPAYAQRAYAPYGAYGNMLDWGANQGLNYWMLNQMGAFNNPRNAPATGYPIP